MEGKVYPERPGLMVRVPQPGDQPNDVPGGPPHKYTKEIHDKIITHIMAGRTPEWVAAACGISSTCLKEWLRKGQAGDPWLEGFAQDYHMAMAKAALGLEDTLLSATKYGKTNECPTCGHTPDMKMSDRLAQAKLVADLLAAKHPAQYSPRDRENINHQLTSFLRDCKKELDSAAFLKILAIAQRTSSTAE